MSILKNGHTCLFFVGFPTTILYYLYKGTGSSDNFKPNQYPPITILVARTQCVFSVSLRTGKRLARTTVKRIVISPADKQKQTTPIFRARVIVHA